MRIVSICKVMSTVGQQWSFPLLKVLGRRPIRWVGVDWGSGLQATSQVDDSRGPSRSGVRGRRSRRSSIGNGTTGSLFSARVLRALDACRSWPALVGVCGGGMTYHDRRPPQARKPLPDRQRRQGLTSGPVPHQGHPPWAGHASRSPIQPPDALARAARTSASAASAMWA